MQVGTCRIETFLDDQWLAARELGAQFAFDEQLVGAAPKNGNVMIDIEGHRSRLGEGSIGLGLVRHAAR
jgi:hypothetical protein